MGDKGSVVVIGSGASGLGAARSLADSGWDVTVVEKGKVGGTCLWRGCMPKKALFNSARALRQRDKDEQFGLSACDPDYDWQSVLGWKWHSQETYAGDQEALLAERGIRLVKAHGRFAADNAVEAAGERLTFDHAVIATGSEPSIPPVDGMELADTSTDALGYHDVPASLLIVGGGYVGLEFAGIFSALGTVVTVVSAGPRPLEMIDVDCAQVAVKRLSAAGVTFYSDCRMQELSGIPGAVGARFKDSSGTLHDGTYERVLVATGRKPATSLDLDAAGIELSDHGLIVHDEYMRTTNPTVWVVGDSAGGMMQTPVASYEGRTVARSIDSGTPVAPDCRYVPTTVFTNPPIAQVGASPEQLDAEGTEYRTSITRFEYLGAAIIEDERDGLVKLLFAEEDGRLLGAHIAGPTAHDLIYSMAVALRMGARDTDLQEVLGIHPAYSESLNWAAS